MRKPERLGRKLLGLTGAALVLLLWQWLRIPCVIRSLAGIPCPGCGLTRAWLAVLRLDLSAAFSLHPMFWCIPILAVFLLYDGKVFRNKRVNTVSLCVLLAGFFGVYLARLLGFLGGFSLI